MKKTVVVIGKGLLADDVIDGLDKDYEVIHLDDVRSDQIPKTAMIIVAIYNEEGTYVSDIKDDEVLMQTGIPWLRAIVSGDEGIIGPIVRPGKPGCCQCADNRRLSVEQDTNDTAAGNLILPLFKESPSSPFITRSVVRHMACLLLAEIRKYLLEGCAQTDEHMYILNLKTLKNTLHYILPDPSCSVCGNLPDDTAVAAQISLAPRSKISADSYRGHSKDDLGEVLIRDYLDPRTGLCNAKIQDLVSPFASVGINLLSFLHGSEWTAGKSHCYQESEMTAILEALERHCGQMPLGKRTVIHDSFHHLADKALDPVTVGLHTEEQYAHSDFPFERYDPEEPIDWVWGCSLLQNRLILVPESIAYYNTGNVGSFVQESSNGCALGGSLEEAILYGIMEVVERDSFLITWYGKLPAPRLDPYSANDKELTWMVDKLRLVAGYEIHLFNITTENGIPSIWALAKGTAPGKMNLICSAGAHLNPIKAAKSAIHELAGMMYYLEEALSKGLDEITAMLDNPFLVEHMRDHAMLYGLPQTEERLSFLLDSPRPLRTFDTEFTRKINHSDLSDDLRDIMKVFERLNLDIIVVDQSTPETVKNGLFCVKVLIPGMLPMTFGHRFQRLAGLDRVLKVPVELGYTNVPLKREQLNLHPHPFL